MKKGIWIKGAMAALAVCCAGEIAASIYYSVPADGTRDWSCVAAWKDSGSINRLPNANDDVYLDSSLLRLPTPLVISSVATAGVLRVSQYDGNINNYAADGRIVGLEIVEGGKLRIENTSLMTCFSCGQSSGCWGNLAFRGGSVWSSNFTLGHYGIGTATNFAGTVTITNCTYLGRYAKARGEYVQKGGETYLGSLLVAESGTGTYIHEGGVTKAKNIKVGAASGGVGQLLVKSPNFAVTNLYVGVEGVGEAVLASGTTMRGSYLKIGGTMAAVSRLTLEENAKSVIENAWQIGGYVDPEQKNRTLLGRGELVLRGGVLAGVQSGDLNLIVTRTEGSEGVVRGWGEFRGVANADNNNFRMANNGRIIADGEGVARTLDLSRVVSSTNQFANGFTGTNGWYAVNKGLLSYPRTYKNATVALSNPSYGVGEAAHIPASDLDLVNSLRVTFTGLECEDYGTALRADLYAVDRDDYPRGLPEREDRTVLGVWALWMQQAHNAKSRRQFETADVQIRYDHAALKPGMSVSLWRYRNGAWSRVARQTVAETNHDPRISSGPQPRDIDVPRAQDGGTVNVGWYAVTCDAYRGTVVIVR